MSKEIKISDELLSSVLGCECEFESINHVNIYFKPIDVEKFWKNELFDEWIVSQDDADYFKINLHTFIHLAKIKAFECGYEIETKVDCVGVFYCNESVVIEVFTSNKTINYNICNDIKALEWIQKEVKNG